MAATLVMTSVGLAALAVYLWVLGLEQANQVSSVGAMFASLLSLVDDAVTLLRPGSSVAIGASGAAASYGVGVLRLDDDVRRLPEVTVSIGDE